MPLRLARQDTLPQPFAIRRNYRKTVENFMASDMTLALVTNVGVNPMAVSGGLRSICHREIEYYGKVYVKTRNGSIYLEKACRDSDELPEFGAHLVKSPGK